MAVRLLFLNFPNVVLVVMARPTQLAELPRSEFDPELFPHSAYVKFFCDIRNKSAVFNILRQKVTNLIKEISRSPAPSSSGLRNPAVGYVPVLHHSLNGGLWVIT